MKLYLLVTSDSHTKQAMRYLPPQTLINYVMREINWHEYMPYIPLNSTNQSLAD